ncbi:hypothetical protein [Anabaenopsis arnoldii]|uniref:Uncharacterized protein n=1 Tax=Anabaenopsis arnoldii TaxID=2152938 RepID=A0ABT5APB6_9CYAN|nr:hypothetical protein [Anabaenopsis arnoldii]MDB9539125.1 hypothetical protein [Anabaenopsis arnoldii]MDH6091413.1 hypothetical protein [Anabaenopsis arnoldii]
MAAVNYNILTDRDRYGKLKNIDFNFAFRSTAYRGRRSQLLTPHLRGRGDREALLQTDRTRAGDKPAGELIPRLKAKVH